MCSRARRVRLWPAVEVEVHVARGGSTRSPAHPSDGMDAGEDHFLETSIPTTTSRCERLDTGRLLSAVWLRPACWMTQARRTGADRFILNNARDGLAGRVRNG